MIYPTDLDTADILAARLTYVPVNARVDQAIAAHRIAYKAFESDLDDPDGRQLGMYTLHAVVLSRTPEVDDYRAQLDYLTALPANVWPNNPGWTEEAILKRRGLGAWVGAWRAERLLTLRHLTFHRRGLLNLLQLSGHL